jgi:hypothetical protein
MKQINKNQIHTIGHSNRSLEDLIKILKYYGIEALVDVRRFPTSRHNPQFKKDVLENKLPESGIEYVWIENLGGFRKGGYVEYTETKEFRDELEKLIEIAKQKFCGLSATAILLLLPSPGWAGRLFIFTTIRNWISTSLWRASFAGRIAVLINY